MQTLKKRREFSFPSPQISIWDQSCERAASLPHIKINHNVVLNLQDSLPFIITKSP